VRELRRGSEPVAVEPQVLDLLIYLMQAMRLARAAIRQRGDYVGGHRLLTAAASMAGLTDVATAALQELRRAQPSISLAWIADQMPFKQDAEREHYVEAFRRAGLG
jgi:hypothetical protein